MGHSIRFILGSYLFPTRFLSPMAASKIGLQAATSRGMKNRMVEPDRAEELIKKSLYETSEEN
jgi:hypothetical protein